MGSWAQNARERFREAHASVLIGLDDALLRKAFVRAVTAAPRPRQKICFETWKLHGRRDEKHASDSCQNLRERMHHLGTPTRKRMKTSNVRRCMRKRSESGRRRKSCLGQRGRRRRKRKREKYSRKQSDRQKIC